MEEIKDKLEKYMKSWEEANRFSGTVLVCKEEEVLLKKGYGYENVQYGIKNGVNTKYKIGSYTKQFIAVAILKLYEEQKLKLKDKINIYIPEYKHSACITIHNLLSHTSGIPEHTNFKEYRISETITFNTIIDRLNGRDLDFMPGERGDYSNSNYVLLCKIVEIVSGMDIETFLKKYLFEPLELHNTGISRNEDIIPKLSQGYSFSGQGIINADYYDMSGAYGSGFLYSNVEDVLKWIRALLSGKIINHETLKKMMTPYQHIWYMNGWAGYGCFINVDKCHEMIGNGLISGYIFNIWVDLKNNYLAILLGNNDTIAIEKVLKGIKNILFDENALIEIKPKAKGIINNLQILKNIEGKYKCKYTGGEFNISIERNEAFVDRLWVQEYKVTKFRLEFIEEDEEKIVFACEVCDGKFVFSKASNGAIKEAIYIYDTITLPYCKVE